MPRPPSPQTIRGALFALVAFAFVPLAVLGAWEVARDYREHRDAETRASNELARSIAVAGEEFVQDVLRTQWALAASFATHASTPAKMEQVLALVVARLPAVRDMSWLDGQGRAVASTEPQLVGKSFYARDYFQEIARGAEWRVSPVLQSVVDARATFVVARGIRDPAGALRAVITAAVDADAFGAVVLRDRGGTRASTSIRDSQGTLVAIVPARPLGWDDRRRGSATSWIRRALSGGESVGVFESPLTGERRIGAIVPLPSLGWAAHASRPFHDAIAPVRRSAFVLGAVLLAMILGALAAALYVARQIALPLHALEAEAGRLAAGGRPGDELRGPVEVRQVTAALRAMATGLAERRAELDRLHDERETLMRSVSHDLRTPLHVIVGHAKLLLKRHGEAPELRHRADAILASAGRMTRLVGDLVDAARLEADHVELQLEAMDLASFVSGWKERVAEALQVERVHVDIPPSVPAIRADPDRLDQILANLVSNALKYSLPGSAVRVALTAEPPGLRLAISDVGPGIPADDMPRLFERYYRAKGTTGAEGLGLGLFITRKLVEAHGWRIEVESEVGKGSVFTVVIPPYGATTAGPPSSAGTGTDPSVANRSRRA